LEAAEVEAAVVEAAVVEAAVVEAAVFHALGQCSLRLLQLGFEADDLPARTLDSSSTLIFCQ
jgi:hypothetical protein